MSDLRDKRDGGGEGKKGQSEGAVRIVPDEGPTGTRWWGVSLVD